MNGPLVAYLEASRSEWNWFEARSAEDTPVFDAQRLYFRDLHASLRERAATVHRPNPVRFSSNAQGDEYWLDCEAAIVFPEARRRYHQEQDDVARIARWNAEMQDVIKPQMDLVWTLKETLREALQTLNVQLGPESAALQAALMDQHQQVYANWKRFSDEYQVYEDQVFEITERRAREQQGDRGSRRVAPF